MSIVRTLASIACALATVSISSAKEWHGIVPLHSTRADVERILGPGADPTKEHVSLHRTEDAVILVVYSTGSPCSGGLNAWKVPRGTVVNINVTPKTAWHFADLNLDESKYKITDGGHVPGFAYYTDEKEGVQFEVTRGIVAGITYFPSAEDNHLRCLDPPSKVGCVSIKP